mmetsp:Transcript_32021/g.68224  ORF Transcript_32021/g.68224 Transcript_32021/m.68224 type:complete len:516 (-) Transcript_32021:44-1591(-)
MEAPLAARATTTTTKPCRSGASGMRPFGTLGPSIDAANYGLQWKEKVQLVKTELECVIKAPVLNEATLIESPPKGHRHRAGPLAVLRGVAEARHRMELAMWDPVAQAHSIVRPEEVPIYSPEISAAMRVLRAVPIELDKDLPQAASASSGCQSDVADFDDDDDDDSENDKDDDRDIPFRTATSGSVLGKGLRSVQLQSTLSGELLVCLCYFDERLKTRKRSEQLPEDHDPEVWRRAAGELRDCFMEAFERRAAATAATGATTTREGSIHIVGRWRRRKLAVDQDFITEVFHLQGELPGEERRLSYKQPEGQFSNPNSPCEVRCLEWLCKEARRIVSERPDAKLLELHCGGGCNTIALAPCFSSVVAIEINRVLAEVAEENIARNSLSNVQIVRSPSAQAQAHARDASVVLVDPPRAGLDGDTLAAVQNFQDVLYISCNPAALARDLALLCEHDVLSLAIFDMFPYTTHAECAVWLRRRARKSSSLSLGAAVFVVGLAVVTTLAFSVLRRPGPAGQ